MRTAVLEREAKDEQMEYMVVVVVYTFLYCVLDYFLKRDENEN